MSGPSRGSVCCLTASLAPGSITQGHNKILITRHSFVSDLSTAVCLLPDSENNKVKTFPNALKLKVF